MSTAQGERRYILGLALIAAAILIIGAKLRPPKVAETVVSPAEMVRLQRLTQRRTLENLTSYFPRLADEVKPGVVWLEGLATSGVVWRSGAIATSYPAKHPRAGIFAAGPAGRQGLDPEILSPLFPVALLKERTPSAVRPVFRTTPAALEQGAWLLQVVSQAGGGHLITPGVYGGVSRVRCGDFQVDAVKTNLPLGDLTLGGGIFELNGNLVGLILACGDSRQAVTPESVDEIVAEASSFAGQIIRRYGFRVAALTPETRRLFQAETGLLVTEVAAGTRAELAGLEPGDVIQALEETPVNAIDDLARLVLPVAYPRFTLYVRRGAKVAPLGLEACDSDSPPVLLKPDQPGILFASPPEGYPIESIAPGSPAERAALAPGDRILSVNGRRHRNVAEIEQALSSNGSRPAFLVVQRGQRKLGVVLR